MKKLSVVFILVLSILFMQSCQKEDVEPVNPDPYAEMDAPELPPVESFIIPFGTFADGKGKIDSSITANSRSIENFVYSAVNVLVWNTVLTVQLAIPVSAFFESFNHQAVYQGQGVWLWSYEVTENGETYIANLYGELLQSQEVKWDMYITKVGEYTDFHWYTGITAWDESYANWNLHFSPDDPFSYMDIDFEKDNGNGESAIRYTYVIPGIPEDGNYIEYREGNDTNANYDRAYDVLKAEIDNLLQIQWNSIDINGRVKDLEHFLDEEWHCWGPDLKDTDC
jgi:hypothetical protein